MIARILLLFVSLPCICFAEDMVSMPMTILSDIVVEVEKGKLYQQEIEVLKQNNKNLEEQNNLLRDTVRLQKDQISLYNEKLQLCEGTISRYKDVIKMQEDMCEKSKPTFFDKLKQTSFGIVIGGAIVSLLFLF